MNHSSDGKYRGNSFIYVLREFICIFSVVRQNMIPMLPTLLMYISNKGLPCSAKIEVR